MAEYTKDHTNKYAKQVQSSLLKRLLEQPLVGVATHWTFQGMLYMDSTERRFKIVCDALFSLLGFAWLKRHVPTGFALSSAFFLAHTLNFFFNAQLWVALKHYGMVQLTYEAFEGYSRRLADRIRREPTLCYAALYGSRVRDEWHPGSDLDVRVVRRAGWWYGLRACCFVMSERTRALWAGFPLDIYLLDSLEPLSKMSGDEEPLVLLAEDAKN